MDAITTALNANQEKQEKQSNAFESFLKENKDLINEIENDYVVVDNLRKSYKGDDFVYDNDDTIYDICEKVRELDKLSQSFQGYDFSEEVSEMFEEIE